ncbi:ORF6N domain-containing protein [Clostridium sporogenes]|uniref:ORF6N domain-containing protein n=1 Tax=Clostridium sporogenes TaxID=1509 RepID=UPI0013D2CA8B|nr:ORF6N domain-containing protein [Clostridium sporogenes]NFQ84141.1 ORF6N domain-containing protein [Clostridium sporogenes]
MGNLVPIEFKNERVITTELLAEIYETDINNIQANFKNHKGNFIKGKHYYLLQGEELKEFKNHLNNIQTPIVNKFTSSLYLWTERGANRHCKILDTDKAWEQFDNLEETYFRVKEQKVAVKQLSPELQAFKQIFDGMAKQELEQKRLQAEVVATKEEIAAVREVITINPKEEWRKETNKWISKICYKLQDYKTPKDEIYKALEERAKCKLSVRLKNLQGRAALNGMAQSQVDKLNNLDVIANDVRLKEIYIAIVKQMAIKQGVKAESEIACTK